MKKAPVEITEEQKKMIVELRKQGLSYTKIAQKVGCGKTTARKWAGRLIEGKFQPTVKKPAKRKKVFNGPSPIFKQAKPRKVGNINPGDKVSIIKGTFKGKIGRAVRKTNLGFPCKQYLLVDINMSGSYEWILEPWLEKIS